MRILLATAVAALPHLADAHPCPHAHGFTCSTLVVPLDRSGRLPGTLRLAVAAADDAAAPKGVLLQLTGGPGQPGVPFAEDLRAMLAPAVSKAYRLVVFDQRGTGAGALRCPALQAQMGFSDLYPPTARAVRACAAAVGAKRSLFGTDDVVADMDALREALGVDSWTLDGVSYGTFVAERYAVAHPTHVKRLVLDSVVPHAGRFDLGLAETRAAARVLRSACGPRCVDDLAAVVARRHLGPELFDALTFVSIVDPTYKRLDFPAALHRARAGSTTQLRFLLGVVHESEHAAAAELSQGLHASALCGDWRFPWGSSAAPLAGREAALRRAVDAIPAASIRPFDRATLLDDGIVRQCIAWPPTAPTPSVARKLPNVPTLLLEGDRDLSAPLEWAREEAAVAPGGRLVVIHGAGHSVQTSGTDAGRRAVMRFLLGG